MSDPGYTEARAVAEAAWRPGENTWVNQAVGHDALGRAARAVADHRDYQDQDYALDGSGELGAVIGRGHNRQENRLVEAHGFTAESYNRALRGRLAPDYPRMEEETHYVLLELEVEPTDEYDDHHTFVNTGGEQSSLAYLKGDESPATPRSAV